MTRIEKEEFCHRIRGMSNEEMSVMLTIIPRDMLWNELRRREEEDRRMIEAMRNLLNDEEGK